MQGYGQRCAREADLAARWAAGGWRGRTLRAAGGEEYTLIYQGRPGGGAGPDFRDAVLARPDGSRVYGDVELHLRASAWHAHGHNADPRYDGLALHVALAGARPAPSAGTRLASGRLVPLVLLGSAVPDARGYPAEAWPCLALTTDATKGVGADERHALLMAAGMARFVLRADAFVAALEIGRGGPDPPGAIWDAANRALLIALAEALAYGRDRASLRLAGERLAGGTPPAALLAESVRLPRVEGRRLLGLLQLFDRWQTDGPWAPLRAALTTGTPRKGGRALVACLRVGEGLVSPGRAAILAANVALPFADAWARDAWARSAPDADARGRARAVHAALPGLPSNAITREMVRQLGLPRLPSGATTQLGLQHIWARWCREKRCAGCPCNLAHGVVRG